MPTDHRPVSASLSCASLSTAALLTGLFVLAAPVAGMADTAQEDGQEEAGATERMAAALEESPVYVDPSYTGAFPEESAEELERQITESGIPLRVVIIPLIEGGDWSGEADVMAAAVHDRVDGEAHYLVLDGQRLTGHDFVDSADGQVDRASHAQHGVFYEMAFDAPAPDKVERAVDIALSDDPEAIHRTAADDRESGPFDWMYSLGPGLYTAVVVLPWVLAGLALFALGFGLYRWRRPRAAPALPQHAAFANASRARRDELAERAERELVEVGERLSDAVPVADDPAATEALHRALDAHAAARRVHDALPEEGAMDDIVGVLVLLDTAESQMARATRPAQQMRSLPGRSHCYANPLHGTDTKVTRWRAFGGREDVRVPLCAVCAKAVRDRSRPTVLSARYEGRDVPYYEVPAAESVWAATGYGTLREDMVERVLRGDHARETR
ncbi:hypothetical protein [Nocardiopsis nanhaiensis]